MSAALLVALAVSGTAGCARRRAGGTQSSAAPAVPIGPIPLRVVNRGTSEAAVYAVRGSFRQRLGLVAGLSTVSVVVPASVTADRGTFVVLVTQIGGSERYVSDTIVPQPDILLVVNLAPRLSASTLSIQ